MVIITQSRHSQLTLCPAFLVSFLVQVFNKVSHCGCCPAGPFIGLLHQPIPFPEEFEFHFPLQRATQALPNRIWILLSRTHLVRKRIWYLDWRAGWKGRYHRVSNWPPNIQVKIFRLASMAGKCIGPSQIGSSCRAR